MRARLITAAVGIPVVIAALYFGGPIFYGFMALYSFGAMFELACMLHLPRYKSILIGATTIVPYFANLYFHFLSWDIYLLLYIILSASYYFVFGFQQYSMEQASGIIFGGIFITVLSSTLVLIRDLEQGIYLTLAVFLVTWGTDTFAFFTGKLLGKKKLAPGISPGKTWAGACGGFFFGVIIATVFGILIKGNLLIFTLWGATAAIFGQLGDLCESALKRHAKVKDSGKFFPGHGGFLDRIDSLLFVSALAYIFFGLGQ